MTLKQFTVDKAVNYLKIIGLKTNVLGKHTKIRFLDSQYIRAHAVKDRNA
jgi:hypothetical protein